MKDVHLVVGVVALALNGAAALLGAWSWRRAEPSRAFWIVLRAGQAVLVLEVALGGILLLLGKKVSGLHILYGILPVLVSFLGEQLRLSSAEMVLHAHGFESAAEVGELPVDEQRGVALAIVQREVGVMTIAAWVIVVLLVRAAGTAG
jgi:hypothetical protein